MLQRIMGQGVRFGVWAMVSLCAVSAWAQTGAPNPAAGATPAPNGTASQQGAQQPAKPAATGSGGAATPGTAPATPDAAPRNPAAKVNLVDGSVKIVSPDKTSHQSVVGEQLYEGDAIVTGDSAEVHLDMADGGFIAVRPNTQIRIAKYQANGDENDVSVIGLLKGSLRSITGWIGKTYPKKYAVVTPSATIGVRGTDHEPAYVPEGTQGTDAGTYDTVHAGQTSIANSKGSIDVLPGRAGFVDHQGLSQPRVLDKVPAFFQAPHRHDAVFVGKHERIAAGLEQRRVQRVQQHAQELKQGGPGARGPGAAGQSAREAPRALVHAPAAAGRTPQSGTAAHTPAANAARSPAPNAAQPAHPAAPQQQGSFLQNLLKRPGTPQGAHPLEPAKKPLPIEPKKKTN